ncbi:MAG: dual specificity protein phosphatase family protein [Corticimicrobacter sp.]|uniref:dual specificity protein phosphatase family protein n=1 Tax=Corticimicrobacter sp. TaxID=2678536 RepID=UPI0032DA75DF
MMFKLLKRLALGGVGLVAVVALHAGINQMTGNFHEVIDGQVYRSAQPDGDDLREYVEEYGIRTVLNLRDEDHGEWYQEESQAAAALGVRLVDYPVSSGKGLSVAAAEELALLMQTLPKPLLIHCEHGANRTGLASAIYVDAVAKGSELAAFWQLSPYYGHVPIKGIGRYAIFTSYLDFQRLSEM